jgi:ribosome-associated protein
MTDPHFDIDPEETDEKSKTQLKNEMLALRKMGLTLVDLTQATLLKIPLDDELKDAIMLARRINRKKDGFRRQLALIGKMLRNRDVETIEHALLVIESGHHKAVSKFHKLEELRDDLIHRGDEAINTAVEEHEQLDRQKLRQLIRQATKEAAENKPPKSSRELFKYLKEQLGE